MDDIPACFTPNDVRGPVPSEFNKETAARIALAFLDHYQLNHVIVGRDIRRSSPEIAHAVCQALLAAGCQVTDIGLCGTEEMYHAVFSRAGKEIDGGIMLTASHNPANYNGMKLVGPGAQPISQKSGLAEIAKKSLLPRKEKTSKIGTYTLNEAKEPYIRNLLSIVGTNEMRPLKLVVNSGNGCAGPVVDLLAQHLPFTFVRLQHKPDGAFPNGVPNPLLPDCRSLTAEAVRTHRADLGIAWDGDFDRCFFFDENGRFIEGYYIVGLLAEAMLTLYPKATVLHDTRLIWNTEEVVRRAGGKPIMVRSGHALIKEAMRKYKAVYGGEMSAHHYFSDFGYCDSGMLPWLLVCRLLSQKKQTLSSLCDAFIKAYPVSGEINTPIAVSPEIVLQAIMHRYADGELDKTDGISVSYKDYRFNLRKSSTEPFLRLNVETRGNSQLLADKTSELLTLIQSVQ